MSISRLDTKRLNRYIGENCKNKQTYFNQGLSAIEDKFAHSKMNIRDFFLFCVSNRDSTDPKNLWLTELAKNKRDSYFPVYYPQGFVEALGFGLIMELKDKAFDNKGNFNIDLFKQKLQNSIETLANPQEISQLQHLQNHMDTDYLKNITKSGNQVSFGIDKWYHKEKKYEKIWDLKNDDQGAPKVSDIFHKSASFTNRRETPDTASLSKYNTDLLVKAVNKDQLTGIADRLVTGPLQSDKLVIIDNIKNQRNSTDIKSEIVKNLAVLCKHSNKVSRFIGGSLPNNLVYAVNLLLDMQIEERESTTFDIVIKDDDISTAAAATAREKMCGTLLFEIITQYEDKSALVASADIKNAKQIAILCKKLNTTQHFIGYLQNEYTPKYHNIKYLEDLFWDDMYKNFIFSNFLAFHKEYKPLGNNNNEMTPWDTGFSAQDIYDNGTVLNGYAQDLFNRGELDRVVMTESDDMRQAAMDMRKAAMDDAYNNLKGEGFTHFQKKLFHLSRTKMWVSLRKIDAFTAMFLDLENELLATKTKTVRHLLRLNSGMTAELKKYKLWCIDEALKYIMSQDLPTGNLTENIIREQKQKVTDFFMNDNYTW